MVSISAEGVIGLALEALLRGVSAPNKAFHQVSVVLLAVVAVVAVYAGLFLVLRVCGRLGKFATVCGFVGMVILYIGSTCTMFAFFIIDIENLNFAAESIAMWIILFVLLLYMMDCAYAPPQEGRTSPSGWALSCAVLVVLEMYVKSVISPEEIVGEEKKPDIFRYMLRTVTKAERYGATTLLLHVTMTIAVYMVFHLRFKGIWRIIGSILSLSIVTLGSVQYLSLLFKKIWKAPHFFESTMPVFISPVYLVICSAYYMGAFDLLYESLPQMWIEVRGVDEAFRQLFTDGIKAVRAAIDWTKEIFNKVCARVGVFKNATCARVKNAFLGLKTKFVDFIKKCKVKKNKIPLSSSVELSNI